MKEVEKSEQAVKELIDAVRSITAADYARVLSGAQPRLGNAISPLTREFVEKIAPPPERISANFAAINAAKPKP